MNAQPFHEESAGVTEGCITTGRGIYWKAWQWSGAEIAKTWAKAAGVRGREKTCQRHTLDVNGQKLASMSCGEAMTEKKKTQE